nr:MAG TPA: hypothetical protein [Caudoviricetes sp.]
MKFRIKQQTLSKEERGPVVVTGSLLLYSRKNNSFYEETYLKGEVLCLKLLIFGMMTILEARTVARL